MEDPRRPKRNLNFRIKTEPACHGLTAGSDATVYVQLLYTYISNCDRLGFNVEIQIYIGTVQVHISFAKEKVCRCPATSIDVGLALEGRWIKGEPLEEGEARAEGIRNGR